MATNSEIKTFNPSLYWDGVCRNIIPASEASFLNIGDPVQSPFTQAFLGGPHQPVATSFDPSSGVPIGPNDSYPKPWRSAEQKLTELSNGSLVGPYARMVKIPPELRTFCVDACADPVTKLCGGADGGLYGRLGLGDDVVGFRTQNWYYQDEGTYDTAYYNNQGTNWPTWKEWWANVHKETIYARWEEAPGAPIVECEVAMEDLGPGDGGYWPGPGLSGVASASYDMLVAMVALAAFTRW